MARCYNLKITTVESCDLAQVKPLGERHYAGINCLQSQGRISRQQFRHPSVVVRRDFYDPQFKRRNLREIQALAKPFEFIHGDLPVTLNLLKEAGITYQPAYGEMWHYKNGRFDNDGGVIEGWGLLEEKLKTIDKDLSINEFLDKEFAGDEYNDLKNSVRQFAAGYDSADPDKGSTFALRNEWLSEDDDTPLASTTFLTRIFSLI